jgi:hypothetical protein
LEIYFFGKKIISKKILKKKKSHPGLEVAEKKFFKKGK